MSMKKANARLWVGKNRVRYITDERQGHPDDFPIYWSPRTWLFWDTILVMEEA